MERDYFLDREGNFIIGDYNNKPAFSSFLPGIAGEYGVPLWVFYVNRAQAIASLGSCDKDHSILEFFPANQSYRELFQRGFRTFLKLDSLYYEPFGLNIHKKFTLENYLKINSSFLELGETNSTLGLEVRVRYFTLAGEDFGGLIRIVEIVSKKRSPRDLEFLDGLSLMVPYGAPNLFLKNLSRTLEAWMQTQIERDILLSRIKVHPKDTSSTFYIKGANFYLSCYFEANKPVFLKMIGEKELIFKDDFSLVFPYKFVDKKFRYPSQQVLSGKTPCAFSYFKGRIKPFSPLRIFSLVGAVEREDTIFKFLPKINPEFIEEKFRENFRLIKSIKDKAFSISGCREFDLYISQSYLDNILRGGYPQVIGDRRSTPKIFYLYSRKHGDLERDYNKFKLLPCFYSSGEANYRDVNQNRRCDNFFTPFLDRENIHLFFNLQRLDGYNPLVVKPCRLLFRDRVSFKKSLGGFLPGDIDKERLIKSEFYLGDLLKVLSQAGLGRDKLKEVVASLVSYAEKTENAEFGEGFWIDHWTYNLDLIETYLSLYPDRLEALLFEEVYTFYDDAWKINPRLKRYYLKGDRVYQGNFLNFSEDKASLINERKSFKHRARVDKGRGQIYYTNLLVKLLILVMNKLATLDPFGRGIEMEAEKPGWCDALNGLPALCGSSLAETFELKRLCLFLKSVLEKFPPARKIGVFPELFFFLTGLKALLGKEMEDFKFWDRASFLKEKYREEVFWGPSSKKYYLHLSEIEDFLGLVLKKLDRGLEPFLRKDSVPTYFINEVSQYYKRGSSIRPLKFRQRSLPLFLEGYVHLLRVIGKDKAERIYRFIKKSTLYDKKLKMYKINESIESEDLEIGRIRIFPSGWLENESIWLHMEYKYLLEILKQGLYEQFYKDFFRVFVCFQEPRKYGRSILENSSFLVSSSYSDKKLWGRGFVGRLSGSTAEVLNIFVVMCAGRTCFFLEEGKLFLEFKPILERRLFTTRSQKVTYFREGEEKEIEIEKDCFAFKFLDSTLVIYHNPLRKDTFLPEVRIEKAVILYKSGEKITIPSSKIPPPHSLRIREGEAERIDLFISQNYSKNSFQDN